MLVGLTAAGRVAGLALGVEPGTGGALAGAASPKELTILVTDDDGYLAPIATTAGGCRLTAVNCISKVTSCSNDLAAFDNGYAEISPLGTGT